MDKKVVGLIGALTTLGGAGVANAAPAQAPADVMEVRSYADLLTPIPNALALLQEADAARNLKAQAEGSDDKAGVELAQYHHHHHHHHWRRWHHHHHHWFHHHHHHYY